MKKNSEQKKPENESAPLKVAFAGTPEFAIAALEAIQAAGFEIALILTQPDRPSGRGMKVQASAVKQWGVAHGVRVIQPRSLRLDGKFSEEAEAARAELVASRADIMVVAAYGLILPQWVLDLPALGCLNIHGSLLPRWRGAAPIQRAIEAGDASSGISIMQMDAGLDTGPELLSQSVEIELVDTTGSLHDKLSALGSRLVVDALRLAERGALVPKSQPTEGATYARKIEKSEAALDWTKSAEVLERKIRAFDPLPGATCDIKGETVKIWGARVELRPGDDACEPGIILEVDASGVLVACGAGALRLTHLQRSGGKRMPASAFLQGCSLMAGQVLGR